MQTLRPHAVKSRLQGSAWYGQAVAAVESEVAGLKIQVEMRLLQADPLLVAEGSETAVALG